MSFKLEHEVEKIRRALERIARAVEVQSGLKPMEQALHEIREASTVRAVDETTSGN